MDLHQSILRPRGAAALFSAVAAASAALVGTAAPSSAATVSGTPSLSWAPWKACPAASGTSNNCAQVRAIAHTASGNTIIGGDFTEMRSPDGKSRAGVKNLAMLDPAGKWVAGFAGHNFNGTVFSLATDATSVYVGGGFSSVDGKGALHVARLRADNGGRLALTSGVNGNVYAMALLNGKLYVGGKFTQVQSQPRGNLAALNAATGAVDAAWRPNAQLIPNDAYPNDAGHNNVPIRSIATSPDGNRVYVAGDMDLLNGVARPVLAAVSPVTGATDPSFDPNRAAYPLDKTYQGMSISVVDSSGGRTPGIVLGAGGLGNRAWRLNLDGSQAWTQRTSGDVQATAVSGDTAYLGGHFCSVNGVTHIFVVALRYSSPSVPVVDTTWSPQLGTLNNSGHHVGAPYYYGVWALHINNGTLYAGGVFKEVKANGVTYNQPKIVSFKAL